MTLTEQIRSGSFIDRKAAIEQGSLQRQLPSELSKTIQQVRLPLQVWLIH